MRTAPAVWQVKLARKRGLKATCVAATGDKVLRRQIWTGPVLGTNRADLIKRCGELIEAGSPESFLYLTASQPLLNLVTGALLDGERTRGIWGSLPVFLFRGFVRRVLETAIEEDTELPLEPRAVMDSEELPLRHSLVSRIVRRLAAENRLRAIKPVAQRDGSINSIATLIGEIERAAKNPAEFEAIIEAQRRDQSESGIESAVPLQSDYDTDIALIYRNYAEALERFRLTEDDADQLRALDVLRGEAGGRKVSCRWLLDVQLLVIDGFFDFTPVQGEMLRLLVPRIPEVLVNLNFDQSNQAIFAPFEQTIRQLQGMADFELVHDAASQPPASNRDSLRYRLFNADSRPLEPSGGDGERKASPEPAILAWDEGKSSETAVTVYECADRETEIRRIAKEVKRLVLQCGYRISEIAVVVRQKALYSETLVRVMRDEGITTAIDRRVAMAGVPAITAVLKLLRLVDERSREPDTALKMSDLAGAIKSDYFRLSHDDLSAARKRFERDHWALIADARSEIKRSSSAALEAVGRWDTDNLENVIAFVGSELRVDSWLQRARVLTSRFRSALQRELEERTDDETEQLEASAESEEATKSDRDQSRIARLAGSDRRLKIGDVHPAAIAWATLVIEQLVAVIGSIPINGRAGELRSGLLSLLDRLQFASQIKLRARRAGDDGAALNRSALELRGLERLRAAMAAAVKAIDFAGTPDDGAGAPAVSLSSYIDELVRAIRVQSLIESRGDRDGLQVLEATDIRGLRFRAVFVAGLYEGGFPMRVSRDWLYPADARERLKQYGLTLEDISPETLLKEEHYFYQTVCRATEHLYLSRPLVLEDGSETITSYYIDELKRAVEPGVVRREEVRRDFDRFEAGSISTGSELARALVRQDERRRHRASRGNALSAAILNSGLEWATRKGYLSASAHHRIAIERERAGAEFGPYDGTITRRELIGMARRYFGPDHVFSASELSVYGKCPYRFFANKLLRLEPRGEAAVDLTALDAGSLLHEVLRRFLSHHRSQLLTDLNREELVRELNQTADDVFDEHEKRVPPLNPNVWHIDREIRKIVLQQVLRMELDLEEKTRAKGVRPSYFELGFGMRNAESDPSSIEHFLSMEREQESIQLRGQIDRVDTAGDGTAIAYDYKLSRGASRADMVEGRDLQLHIYLVALEKLWERTEVAGGAYYILRGPERGRKRGLYRASKSEYTGMTGAKSVLSDDEWLSVRREMESRIWEFVEGMRRAFFRVAPTAPEQTCSYCDYSTVCRYDRFRISRKLAEE